MAEEQQDEQSPDHPPRPGWVTLNNGDQLETACLGKRLVAKLLDMIILVGILVIIDRSAEGLISIPMIAVRDDLRGALGTLNVEENPWAFLLILNIWVTAIFVYLIVFLYEASFVTARGYTPGKYMMGIRTASVEDGNRPRFRKACRRWIALNPPWFLLSLAAFGPAGIVGQLVNIIVYLSPVWNQQRRGWHDKKAGTVVVKAG